MNYDELARLGEGILVVPQASSPVEEQEKREGVEQAKPQQATVKCEDFTSREAAQKYYDIRATEAERRQDEGHLGAGLRALLF